MLKGKDVPTQDSAARVLRADFLNPTSRMKRQIQPVHQHNQQHLQIQPRNHTDYTGYLQVLICLQHSACILCPLTLPGHCITKGPIPNTGTSLSKCVASRRLGASRYHCDMAKSKIWPLPVPLPPVLVDRDVAVFATARSKPSTSTEQGNMTACD